MNLLRHTSVLQGRASSVALLVVAAVTVFAACVRDEGAEQGQKSLNLVMVVLDTLRADHLGLYGYERATSPHLAALARESFVFERAESAAPWTAPSLISLVTSLYPAVHGVRGFPNPSRMSDDVLTLAEVLKQNGYSTAAFTEGGYAKGDFGLDQGFDAYPQNPGDDESHDSHLLFPSRLADNLERSLSWLREHREEPFFLFFQTYEPHGPYRAPQEFIRRYRPFYDEHREHERVRRALERWNRDREVDPADSLLVNRHNLHCRLALPPLLDKTGFVRANLAHGLDLRTAHQRKPFLKWLRDIYDAEIAYTDEQMNRLWRFLEEERLLDRTLVLVASDHGEGLGDHGQVQHGTVLFEEILRIALILRVPNGGNGPRRIPQLVRSVDVMPTLLELMEISTANLRLQGESLLPLLAGENLELHSFSHARSVSGEEDSLVSVRSDRWRFILDRAAGTGQLYDLKRDPGETRDVADSNPDVVARFRSLLERQDERDQALAAQVGPAARPAELDEKLRRELRALGYIADPEDD